MNSFAVSDLYVHYGCGLTAPGTWINFDIGVPYYIRSLPVAGTGLYWTLARLRKWSHAGNIRFGNIVRGLPVPENSCKGVYCSHVLEHLSLDDARKSLRNTHRILRSDGLFRIVVPDLEPFARNYLEDSAPDAAHRFIRSVYLGSETWPKSLYAIFRNWLADNQRHQHKWMWDKKSLALELREAGFSAIRPAQCGDSRDGRFRDVEDADRWKNAVGYECEK